MKQLNNEQKIIVDDILYQNIKNPTKPFHIFLNKWCRDKENVHPHVYYIKHVTILN
jgi:hypothetical protein